MSVHVRALALATALVLALAGLVFAQPRPSASAAPVQAAADDEVFRGDPIAGQQVVMGAGAAGPAAACFRCHGVQGEGDGAGGFPRLAGQSGWYLLRQLEAYADGRRPNAVMTPIAVQLTAAQRRDAAAYYAVARAPHRPPPGPPGDRELVQLGATLAAVGSPLRGVQSCIGCHGPQGTGVPPDTPFLAGQGASFLEHQLEAWASGRRRDSPDVMADIARRLSPEERRAVALYFSTLSPPGKP